MRLSHFTLSKPLACILVLGLGASGVLQAGQVSSDKACAVWAAFSHTTAESRDSGVSEKALNKKIDDMETANKGFTRDNAEYAKAITRMVYHDFRRKTPAEISNLMHITCKITSP